MSNPEIIAISTIDPGDLLLQSVKNAEHITPELQRAVAEFINIWSKPAKVTNIFGMDIHIDPAMKPNTIRFDYPDGRSDTIEL